MDFAEYLGQLFEDLTAGIYKFSKDDVKILESLGFEFPKIEDAESDYVELEFYHTTLTIGKLKDGFSAKLVGTAELDKEESIYLTTKLHSISQMKDVVELSKELDGLIKKFELAYML